ncbi:MAG TPA: LacI family DNA-binding transcriptional regulator [Thermoanaerobaculia bacterium]|jgi:LacI family transcriptional regulator
MAKLPNRLTTAAPSVTIRDVAAQAGVSVATVSRVFNRKGPVREETYQRVMEIAEGLHYVPHAAARSLSLRSTTTIGVVLPELHGEFFSEVIRGIDVASRQHGYQILLSGSHSDREEMRAVVQAVRGRVDGLIVMSPDLEPSALLTDLPAGVPVVMLNSRVAGRPCITIDNANGAREVTAHLLSLGHRRIAFICGPAQNADAEQRRRGYRNALKAAGMEGDRDLEFGGHFTEESGYEAARRILESKRRPTAIFASNDAMAIGALGALIEAGVRVPEDMALVGFDDIPIARFLAPPLTTVKVPIAELGRRGFEMLLAASNGSADDTRPARLGTQLVIRRSCGAGLNKKTAVKPTQ